MLKGQSKNGGKHERKRPIDPAIGDDHRAVGCGSYYVVRGPPSGNTYYTRDVDRTGDAGAIKFKDEATGFKVTIQQSEVRKIGEDEYEAGVKQGR